MTVLIGLDERAFELEERETEEIFARVCDAKHRTAASSCVELEPGLLRAIASARAPKTGPARRPSVDTLSAWEWSKLTCLVFPTSAGPGAGYSRAVGSRQGSTTSRH